MTREDIIRIVNTAFASEFEIEEEKLVPEARIRDDLGLDSLDIVDMIIVLEQAFSFRLPDRSAVASITTLADLYAFIEKLEEELGKTADEASGTTSDDAHNDEHVQS